MCEETAVSIERPSGNGLALSADLMVLAERELAAFATAVRRKFGSEQAQQSVEDWMQELESMHWENDAIPDWRRLTIAAAARLASRVKT